MTAVLEIGFHFGDYVGLVPGLAISIVLALFLGGRVARRLRVSRFGAMLLVVALGVVLSATVSPSREALLGMSRAQTTCDLSRFWLAPWPEYSHLGETSLNVLLFVPLGVAVGMLPRSPYRLPIVVGSVILPIAIEVTQLAAAPLGRTCQSADVFDNLVGLALGFGLGLIVVRTGRSG